MAEGGAEIEKLQSELLGQLNVIFSQENCWQMIDDISNQIKAFFGNSNILLAIRSSSNIEDLKKLSGAGLFDSILNVQSSESRSIGEAIKAVWKSLYSRRALQSRIKFKISEEKAAMALLIQEMIPSDYSFIIHTTNPVL